MNLTNREVELNYTPSKLIQIEEGETCRIPIPIDRCPISAFEQVIIPNYLATIIIELVLNGFYRLDCSYSRIPRGLRMI